MNTPLKSRTTAILGSATIPGRPEEVFGARAFVARTLSAADKYKVYEGNARHVYPRLDKRLKSQGL